MHESGSHDYEVLLIDDSDGDAELLRHALNDGGLGNLHVTRADRLWMAVELLRRNRYDVVLLDLSLPDSHGRATYHALRECVGDCPIVIVTGNSDDQLGAELVREGAQDCIVKGEYSPHTLARSLRHAVERHRTEKALESAREAAMSASRAKSEFVASVSHEIRTPLNAILGMSDVLLATPLAPDQEEYVRIISRAGTSLLDIINAVLDFAKVEAGRLELQEVTFDLHELIETTCELLAFSAHKKGLALGQRIDENVPRRVKGDPGRLRQILVNLLANAIKFTLEGHVRLDVSPVHGSPDAVCFRVSDTGIGIPEDRRQAIFESFTQADGTVARSYGGTGLGLTISARLAEAMGGKIELESSSGRGSDFRAVIRLAAEEVQPAPRPRARAGQRALVIEDNPLERALLAEALEALDLDVRVAESGEVGIEAVEDAAAVQQPFDMVFVDCRMPGLNGFDVVERLVKRGMGLEQLVMLLTTDHRRGDIDRCQRAGLAGYLFKPVKLSALSELVSATGGETGTGSAAGDEAATGHASPGLRILLAEDSCDNQLLIRAYLRDTNHELVVAVNGIEAIEQFRDAPFDLVLMDMQMPIKDGYSATREIRALECAQGSTRTRIVALTAHAFSGESEKSFAAGCDEHVTKPISKRALLEVIERGRRASPAEAEALPDERHLFTPDPEIAELLPDYLKSRRRELATLHEALGGGDFERIRVLAHNMKGTGAGYGSATLSEIGARMEAAAKVADAAAVESEISELMDLLSNARIAVERSDDGDGDTK